MSCLLIFALLVAIPTLLLVLVAMLIQMGEFMWFGVLLCAWITIAVVRYLNRLTKPATEPQVLVTPTPVAETLPPLQPIPVAGHWLEVNEQKMKATCLVCQRIFDSRHRAQMHPCTGARTSLS